MSLDAQMRSAIKELGEVATAVSAVGTRKQKLIELARLGEDLALRIRGERPEVKKLRIDIVQRSHDVRSADPSGKAARAIRSLMHSIEAAKNQLQRNGLGDVPEEFEVSAGGRTWTIDNFWGYALDEVKPLIGTVERAFKRMAELGLPIDRSMGIALDPSWAGGRLAFYDPPWATFALDPAGGSASSVESAIAERVWHAVMGAAEREAWSSVGAFASAFGTLLSGDKLSADDWARLTVSVGKLAKSWPERMPR